MCKCSATTHMWILLAWFSLGGGGGRKRGYKPLKLGFGMIASAEAKTTNTLNYYLIIQVPICLCYC